MIESPYPELSTKMYDVFKDFVNNQPVNHGDLYNTLIMFVGGIVRITYNKGVAPFTKEQKSKLALGLKQYFDELIDIALYEDKIVH